MVKGVKIHMRSHLDFICFETGPNRYMNFTYFVTLEVVFFRVQYVLPY